MPRLIVLLALVLAATAAFAKGAVSVTAQVVFTEKPSGTVPATDANGAVVTYTVDAVNEADEHVPVSCDHPEGTTGPTPLSRQFVAPVGTTTVICSMVDDTSLSASFTVTVTAPPPPPDNQPPTFTGTPPDLVREATGPSGAAVTFTAPTASDPEDGPIVSTCSPASGSTFALGSTPVTCTATDSRGASAEASFKVTVRDTTPPAITVPPDVKVEAVSSAGTPATEPTIAAFLKGATATDAVDASVAVTTNAPAAFPIGRTTVIFAAQDDAGNKATATSTVTVADTVPPTFSAVPADFSVETGDPTGVVVTYTPPNASDLGSPVPVSCAPPSGTKLAVGSHTVTCTARDGGGNTATATFTVTVVFVDTTPPVFSGTPPDLTREGTGPSGAPVSYTAPAAFDLGKAVPVSCLPASGSTFPLGKTLVRCTAADAAGNTASVSFTVTVVDTTPPTLTVAADIRVEAASSAGTPASNPAIAAFLSSGVATDIVDPTVAVATNAPSIFPVGKTVVTFMARDDAGNLASATATVTVQDTTPPLFSETPPDLTREAAGPDGVVVTYTAPTAVHFGDPAPVACIPVSGSTFALGVTPVVCSSGDAAGNTATSSFEVTVVDTTAPVLTPPADITVAATSPAGAPASNAKIVTFLGSAVASDIVDTSVAITTNAPAIFPVGRTEVTFTAEDDSGNQATGTAHVTVLPPGSTPPPPAPVDRTPPADVTNLTALPGDALVRLSWTPPAQDFNHAVVLRARSDAASATNQVYSGKASTFLDRGLQNGVEYRYTVIAFDAAGNRSAGVVVVATPKLAQMLMAPKDGAKVSRKRPPMLRWRAYPGARYYNVQLFRVRRAAAATGAAADVKVLSAWPNTTHLKLAKTWKYQGHRYSLTKGTYRWCVWPGMAARSTKTYGPMMGKRTFTVR